MPTNQKFAGLGVRLSPGDAVWNRRYALVIPNFNDENTETYRVYAIANCIRHRHPDLTDKDLVKQLKRLVRLEIKYTPEQDWKFFDSNRYPVISLDDCIRQGMGVCHEQAALLSVILNKMDFYAEFAGGHRKFHTGKSTNRGGHAWVNVVERNGDGEEFMIEDCVRASPSFSVPHSAARQFNYFEIPMVSRIVNCRSWAVSNLTLSCKSDIFYHKHLAVTGD